MATDNHNDRPGEKGDSSFGGSDKRHSSPIEREEPQQKDTGLPESGAEGDEQPKEDELINISSADDVNIDEANEAAEEDEVEEEEEEDESPPPPVADTPN